MLTAMIVANALSTLVGTWVGVKLLGIARRTGMLPELLVGIGLFTYAAIAQGSTFASRLLGADAGLGLAMGLMVVRTVAYYVTLCSFAAFAWRVFGAESRWRAALCLAVVSLGAAMAALFTHAEWLEQARGVASPVWRRLGTTPHYVVVFAWMAAEALRYHARMRRRAALGLADPVVANRLLLWGVGTGLSSPIVLALFFLTLMRDRIAELDVIAGWLIMLAGFLNTAVWWLAFAPPAAYVRWLRARAGEGGRG